MVKRELWLYAPSISAYYCQSPVSLDELDASLGPRPSGKAPETCVHPALNRIGIRSIAACFSESITLRTISLRSNQEVETELLASVSILRPGLPSTSSNMAASEPQYFAKARRAGRIIVDGLSIGMYWISEGLPAKQSIRTPQTGPRSLHCELQRCWLSFPRSDLAGH